jgi:hypothetical protein
MESNADECEIKTLSEAELESAAGGMTNGETPLFEAFLCGIASVTGEAKIGPYYCANFGGK